MKWYGLYVQTLYFPLEMWKEISGRTSEEIETDQKKEENDVRTQRKMMMWVLSLHHKDILKMY